MWKWGPIFFSKIWSKEKCACTLKMWKKYKKIKIKPVKQMWDGCISLKVIFVKLFFDVKIFRQSFSSNIFLIHNNQLFIKIN